MQYIREIIRAKRDHKHLPEVIDLIKQHRQWKRYQRNVDVFAYAVPWITLSAIDHLTRYLKKDMRVFEFGGGGSTLFFAARVKELITVEHNIDWYQNLKDEMQKYSSIDWHGYFIGPEDAVTDGLDESNPDHYYSFDQEFRNKTFMKYASSIDKFGEGYFDVVLVDGRVRPSCLKHSLEKVRKGGLLILDNADRPYYLKQMGAELKNFKLLSDHFGPTPYVASFTQTNIWERIT